MAELGSRAATRGHARSKASTHALKLARTHVRMRPHVLACARKIIHLFDCNLATADHLSLILPAPLPAPFPSVTTLAHVPHLCLPTTYLSPRPIRPPLVFPRPAAAPVHTSGSVRCAAPRRARRTDPVTGAPLTSRRVLPNVTLRLAILRHTQVHPSPPRIPCTLETPAYPGQAGRRPGALPRKRRRNPTPPRPTQPIQCLLVAASMSCCRRHGGARPPLRCSLGAC